MRPDPFLLFLSLCCLVIPLSFSVVPATLSVSRGTLAVGTTLMTYDAHRNAISAVAWSPDGRFVASANTSRTVQVWESMTGTPTLTYRNHRSEVLAVARSPDGTRIASGDDDGIVRIWQAPVTCKCASDEQGQPARAL